MKKRFVVCLNSGTPEQHAEFREFAKGKGLGWWHWLSDTWFLTDSSGELTAKDIRDKVLTIFPGVHNIVLELRGTDDTWSGFGPKSKDRNMFKWITNNWKG